MRKHTKYPVAVGVLLVATFSVLDHSEFLRPHGDDRARYHDSIATVTHVADGDTIDIDIPDADAPVTRIRLWGIDCPELAHDENRGDAWYAREASEFVQEHLEGRRVRIALDPNRPSRGKYGRLLAFVYLEDSGEMLNEVLLQEGFAYADRRFRHIFTLRFTDLERRAAKARRGLWEDVTTEQMPAWRQRMLDAGFIRGR